MPRQHENPQPRAKENDPKRRKPNCFVRLTRGRLHISGAAEVCQPHPLPVQPFQASYLIPNGKYRLEPKALSSHKKPVKPPVAVTLIIIGGLLIITPAISDYLYAQTITSAMVRTGATTFNLDGKMGDLYRFGCWFTGSIMVCIAIMASLLPANPEAPRPFPAHPAHDA